MIVHFTPCLLQLLFDPIKETTLVLLAEQILWLPRQWCAALFIRLMPPHGRAEFVSLAVWAVVHVFSLLAFSSASISDNLSSNGLACNGLFVHDSQTGMRLLIVKSPFGLFCNSSPIWGQLAVGCFGSGPGGQIV
jgi:hypothetical protein